MLRRPILVFALALLLAACNFPRLSAPELLEFDVSPNPLDRMRPFTVTWAVDGATRVTIALMAFDYKTTSWGAGDLPGWSLADLPGSGAASFAFPANFRQSLPNYQQVRFKITATDVKGATVTFVADEFALACHALFFDSSRCSLFAPTTTQAIFQRYQYGYVIWRADTRTFWVLQGAQGGFWYVFDDTWTEGETVTLPGDPPEGLIAPEGRFAKVWVAQQVARGLGWAVAAPEPHALKDQFMEARPSDQRFISWPDGAVVTLIDVGGRAQGGPAWYAP